MSGGLREEKLRLIEESLQEAVDIAKSSGVTLGEIIEILTVIHKGE